MSYVLFLDSFQENTSLVESDFNDLKLSKKSVIQCKEKTKSDKKVIDADGGELENLLEKSG